MMNPGNGLSVMLSARTRRRSLGQVSGGSALLDAITMGKIHLAKFILDAVDYNVVNTRDFQGKTPLIRACCIKEEKTRSKAVQLLLEKGADVNSMDDHGRTALSYACELRCNDVVKMLVKNNVDPDIADKNGNTALIFSAMVGNDTAIEILTKSFRRLGLDIDKINKEGMSAILIAAKLGHMECATILAQEGKACLNQRDPVRGMTPEEWARDRGCSTPEVLPFSCRPHSSWLRNARHESFPQSMDISVTADISKLYLSNSPCKIALPQDLQGEAGGITKLQVLEQRDDLSLNRLKLPLTDPLYKKRSSMPNVMVSSSFLYEEDDKFCDQDHRRLYLKPDEPSHAFNVSIESTSKIDVYLESDAKVSPSGSDEHQFVKSSDGGSFANTANESEIKFSGKKTAN